MSITLLASGRGRTVLLFAIWAWLIIGLWASASASNDRNITINFREIDVTLDQITSNINNIEQLLQGINEQFGSTERQREMRALLLEMTTSTGSLAQNFAAWQENTPSSDLLHDFRLMLTQLEERARQFREMIEPKGISRAEAISDLQEIRFSMNRILNAIRHLNRLTDIEASLTDDAIEPVTLSDLHRLVFHAISQIESIQSGSASIELGANENSSTREAVSPALDGAAQDMQQFEASLEMFSAQIADGERRLGPIREASGKAIHGIYALLGALYTEDASGEETWDADSFFTALSAVHTKLIQTKEALDILSRAIEDGTGDPLNKLSRFDLDADCQISSEEFLAALELWIVGEIDRNVLKAVVDAWVMEIPVCVNEPEKPSGDEPQSLSKLEVQARVAANWINFSIHGGNIVSSQVEIFNANGVKIATQQTSGIRLSWNLRTTSGQPVANGVYFYRVTGRTANGKLIISQIKTLAVMR